MVIFNRDQNKLNFMLHSSVFIYISTMQKGKKKHSIHLLQRCQLLVST